MSEAPSSQTRVLLVRHAEAAYETGGNGDGGGSLTPNGRDQVHHLGERLQALGASLILSSETSRAVQTAEIAACVLGIPVQVRVGLQEYDIGQQRGRPYNAPLFESLLTDWRDGKLSVRIPGGEDGDTVSRRVLGVLHDAAAKHPGRTIAVVSHGGAINAVIGRLSPHGVSLMDGALELPHCGLLVLHHRAGQWHASTA